MPESLPPFPVTVRKQVKREQLHRCAACGQIGHIECHHIVPRSMALDIGLTEDEAQCRHNAVGLCPKCHDEIDRYALQDGVLFHEMEEGQAYQLPPGMQRKLDHYREEIAVQRLDSVGRENNVGAFYDEPDFKRAGK